MGAVFEPLYDWKNWRPPGQRLYSLYTDDERKQAEAIIALAGSARTFYGSLLGPAS